MLAIALILAMKTPLIPVATYGAPIERPGPVWYNDDDIPRNCNMHRSMSSIPSFARSAVFVLVQESISNLLDVDTAEVSAATRVYRNPKLKTDALAWLNADMIDGFGVEIPQSAFPRVENVRYLVDLVFMCKKHFGDVDWVHRRLDRVLADDTLRKRQVVPEKQIRKALVDGFAVMATTSIDDADEIRSIDCSTMRRLDAIIMASRQQHFTDYMRNASPAERTALGFGTSTIYPSSLQEQKKRIDDGILGDVLARSATCFKKVDRKLGRLH